MSVLESFNALSGKVDALVVVQGEVVTELAALKAQVLAGSPITADQVDALSAKVDAVTSALKVAE